MAERNVREPEQPVNYAMLSLFQYLASILVILVHCQRLFENEILHFTQKSMFGRMAVPFFLISLAFMLKSSLAKKQEMKLYMKRVLAYFWTLPLPKHYAPVALLAGLLYIGLCYQLWYIPAFLLGLLLVHYFYRKWGARKTGIFLLLLYVMGSIETYYAYFSNSWLTQSFDAFSSPPEMAFSILPFLFTWAISFMIIGISAFSGTILGKSYSCLAFFCC